MLATSGRRAARYGTDADVVIHGDTVRSDAGFFCALGEAINGPGGYFGSTLDGLEDCLAGSDLRTSPLRLTWTGFEGAAQRMEPTVASTAVEILRERRVEVTLA